MANGETQERTTPGVQNIERRNNIVALIERELKAQNSAIQSLKDEIETTKKRIKSENKKEKSSVV